MTPETTMLTWTQINIGEVTQRVTKRSLSEKAEIHIHGIYKNKWLKAANAFIWLGRLNSSTACIDVVLTPDPRVHCSQCGFLLKR